ncbi:MAG: magnesium transporter CorA family protein [Acidimicrobiales bacterium]
MDVRLLASGSVDAITLHDLPGAVGRADTTVWVDFDHTDDDGMAALADPLHYHPAAIEDCHNRTPVPKVHLYSDHIYLAVNGLVRGEDRQLHFQPLKVFVDPRRLVTVLGPTHGAVDVADCHHETEAVRRRLDDGRLRADSAMDLGHAVMTGVLRAHEDLLSALAGEITLLERRVMSCDPSRSEALLEELFALRHDLQTIRTNAAQNREVFARLVEQRAIPEDARLVLEDLYHGFDHLKTAADLEREYLQEVLEVFQTRIASELNVFVRQLTAWGAIGIAGTLIAGIYGMNFAHMPELGWQYGYPLALGMMVVVGLLLAWVFKRRGWL